MSETEHAAVYLGATKIIYESRCSCGWVATRATSYEASQAWRSHKQNHTEETP